MPRMNLNLERAASGKYLPTRQLEALILYGVPALRAKVVEKVIARVYMLTMNHSTYHLVNTVVKSCDKLILSSLVYELRRKIPDVARSKVGNSVLATIIEESPATQLKTIAEEFVLGFNEDELTDACKHPCAHHVIQNLLKHKVSAEVLVPKLEPHIMELSGDINGQHVVSQIVESVSDGPAIVCKALFCAVSGDELVYSFEDKKEILDYMFSQLDENHVVSALLKNENTTDEVKDMIVESIVKKAREFVFAEIKNHKKEENGDEENEPSFASVTDNKPATTKDDEAKKVFVGRHNILLANIFQIYFQSDEPRRKIYEKLTPFLTQMAATKGQSQVVCAIIRCFNDIKIRRVVLKAICGGTIDDSHLFEAATHKYRSSCLRVFFELAMNVIPSKICSAYIAQSVLLASDVVGSPTLQSFIVYAEQKERTQVYELTLPLIPDFSTHPVASYFVQALVEAVTDPTQRTAIATQVLKGLGDLKQGLATAAGCYTLSKIIAYVSDKELKKIVSAFADVEIEDVAEPTEEQRETKKQSVKTLSKKERRLTFGTVQGGRLVDFALHPNSCFVVKALLNETKLRKMESQRKHLMNELKAYVFDLAVSPWAGRVVLDTMLMSGSAKLKEAIKKVVFLTAENWLMEPSSKNSEKGGRLNPIIHKTLREEHWERKSGEKRVRTEESVRSSKK